MNEYAEILKYKSTEEGTMLVVLVPDKDLGDYLRRFSKDGKVNAELRLDDPRFISAAQLKKSRALIGDIAVHTGFDPNYLHDLMKLYYCIESGEDEFSLANCSMTTARHYISYLIEFCFQWDIGFLGKGLDRTDDIDRYLWACIKYRRCSLTGVPGELHHCTGSRIGMGSNRNKVSHSGREFICLSREKHAEIHTIGEEEFFKRYKVYGIKIDDATLKELGYKTDEIEVHK